MAYFHVNVHVFQLFRGGLEDLESRIFDKDERRTSLTQ